MVANRTFWYRFETFVIYIGLAVFALIALAPFVNTLARSFSADAPNIRGEVYLWPVQFTLDAYKRLIVGGAFWTAFRNSFLLTIFGTLFQMVFTVLCAYPLSRPDLPGRKFLTALVVFQLIFPPGLVPLYLAVRQFGMID